MASSKAPASEVALARQSLRKLHETVLNDKSAYTASNSSKLGEAIDKGNSLYAVVREDARGAAIDASFLSTASMLGAEQAGNLEKVTPEKYISKLKAAHGFGASSSSGNKHIKWKQLAAAILDAGIFDHAPAPTFLVGKFEAPQKKQRKEREKKAAEGPSAPMETAASVDLQALQENAMDKAQVVRIKVLLSTIKKGCAASVAHGGPERVNLFQVLLHPTSFSQTVENFFDLAFIVKEGQTRIVSEEGCAYLERAKQATSDDYKAGLVKTQNILKLDVPTWKSLVAKWCTPELPTLLPSRAAGRGTGEAAGAAGAAGAAAASGGKRSRES